MTVLAGSMRREGRPQKLLGFGRQVDDKERAKGEQVPPSRGQLRIVPQRQAYDVIPAEEPEPLMLSLEVSCFTAK